MQTTQLTIQPQSTRLAQYTGKTIVVKYGGNAMINDTLKQAVMQDLLALNRLRIQLVLVHGGGPEISQGLKQIGKESQFIQGLRVTDRETIEIVLQMLAGKVNKQLVALLQGKGVGLSGIDGAMLQCQKCTAHGDLGFVGEIVNVDPSLVKLALESGFIPVISTVGVSSEGEIYNINADTAASQIAIALGAAKLVSMTDIAGLLRDPQDPHSLMTSVSLNDVQQLIDNGVIQGGMIPKIQGCVDFLTNGGEEASIIDGRIAHAIFNELLGEERCGTTLYGANCQ